ncbi:MAG: glycoside hydrolase family 15 protein [Bdellovibrionota bacterium]
MKDEEGFSVRGCVVFFFAFFFCLDAVKASDLPQWIKRQAALSCEKILRQMSPSDGAPGAILASPSRKDPNYYYHWVRDAALTAEALVQVYKTATDPEIKNKTLRELFHFVEFSRSNQKAFTISGLGEPKFLVTGAAFNEPWGRPQNDGPALRALALIRFARELMQNGYAGYVKTVLYDSKLPSHSVIKTDLEYVAKKWREHDFDLWEEVKGHHFFTRMAQRKALLEGATLADALADAQAATHYRREAALIEAEILKHWNAQKRVLEPTLERVDGPDYKTSGLDTGVLLGILYGTRGDGFLPITHDWVLSTLAQLRSVFQQGYAINQKHDFGTLIGRYPEDRYYGGNPWVLTSLAFSQAYAEIAKQIQKDGKIQVTQLNRQFYLGIVGQDALSRKQLVGSAVLLKTEPAFEKIMARLLSESDAMIKRVRVHVHPDGSMAEQMDRNSGFMMSAEDLTWNYVQLLFTVWTRGDLR